MESRRQFTVWRFESPTSGEVKFVPRISEYNEKQYAHHYQQIVWSGYANNKEDALFKSKESN